MKKYISPELGISLFDTEKIVTGSGPYMKELSEWQKANEDAQLTKAKVSDLTKVTKFVY